MTAGEWRRDFFCSHSSKEQQKFCIIENLSCEKTSGGDFAGNVQVSWLVDYTQQNQYNGFGQRVRKQEGSDTTEYFYDGTAGIVEKTKHAALDTSVTVYNFEVEDFHTYYVSEQKVLVHNTCAMTVKNTQVAKSSNNYVYSNDTKALSAPKSKS